MRLISKLLLATGIASLPIAAHGQAFPTLPVTPCVTGCTTINTLPPATQPLLVDGSGVTQPVSGTVGIAGTLPAFAATPAFTISGTLPAFAAIPTFKIDQTTPGTTNLVQIGGTLPAFASTPAFTLSGTGAVTQSGAWSVGITGTLPAFASPPAVAQSGTWTVQPGNTANTTPWLATISQGGNAATVSAGGALKVDGSAATQPVSGTVTIIPPANKNPNCTLILTGTYASGDGFGDSNGVAAGVNSFCELTSAFNTAGGSMTLGTVEVVVYDFNAAYSSDVEVFILRSDPSADAWTLTDNTAFAMGAVGNPGTISYTCTTTVRSSQRATCIIEMAVPFVAAAGSTSLYCGVVTRSAVTVGAGGGSVSCLVHLKG